MGHNWTHALQQISGGYAARSTRISISPPERPEVDWFGQQRLSTVLQGLAIQNAQSVRSVQGLASRTMLNGVSVARRMIENPP
jgi:hypothetical protein